MVLIGVRQAGELTQLKAVRQGLDEMAGWARSQGIDGDDLKILCDDEGPVQVHQISAAIRELVNSCVVEQLLVYFSGHGIYNNGERWLLSMAPEDPSEAVNVEASITLARYCNIAHVVFISDACRDAAKGIQMLQVTGSAIFPSGTANDEMPVDAFFACTRGSVAFEVANGAEPAAPYTALFTSVLSAALRGEATAILDIEEADGKQFGYVRAWKLTDHLREAVPLQLTHMLGAVPRTSQLPGSRITSRNAWLSCMPGPFPAKSGAGWKMRGRSERVTRDAPPTLGQFVARLLPLCHTDVAEWRRLLGEHRGGAEFGQLTHLILLLCSTMVQRNGPVRRLVVRGTPLHHVAGRHGHLAMFPAPDFDTTLIDCADNLRVVVVTAAGHGVLVPLLPDMSAELVFKNGALLDVRYVADGMPLENPALRATLAAASNMGALHLPDVVFPGVPFGAESFVDPTMFLYIAYAQHEAQARCRRAALKTLCARRSGAPLFDLELLAGLDRTANEPPLTPVPMISQGWNLLSAFNVALPQPLLGLEQHLLPSHWTMFDAKGTRQLIAALAAGDI